MFTAEQAAAFRVVENRLAFFTFGVQVEAEERAGIIGPGHHLGRRQKMKESKKVKNGGRNAKGGKSKVKRRREEVTVKRKTRHL